MPPPTDPRIQEILDIVTETQLATDEILEYEIANAEQDAMIEELLLKLLQLIQDIVRMLHPARHFKIGGHMSIPAGGSGSFTATVVPPNGALQAGAVPAWTADDPAVTFLTSADGLSTVASVPATDTTPETTLTITGVNSVDATITGTLKVAITPPVVPATGFTIAQTS